MLTSVHYTPYVGTPTISKKKLQQIHNLVNTAKAFVKAGKTSHGRSFHCCFVLKHGKVQEIGFNSYKKTIDYLEHYGKVKKFSDPNYHMCRHAEVHAILQLGDIDFSRMTFLNVHLDKHNTCRNSKPCLNCLHLMRQVGAKSCMYFDEGQNQWLELKVG